MKLPFVNIDLPPGVFKNGTRYQVKGRWYDANLVRWVDGIMQPVGGWGAYTTTPLVHRARGMWSWLTNGGGRWIAVGTPTQLVVNRGDTNVYDVTPAGFTQGNDNAVEQLGYGGGAYGTGFYGVPRAGGQLIPPMVWQLDNWGEQLVGCAVGDGKLYQWALSTSTPAAVIANAPTSCLGLIVTPQRHLMAFGAGGNKRLAQWSDKENNTLWTPAATNEAGQIEFVTNGAYVTSKRAPSGQILVLTTVDAHVMNYLGQPLIWGRDKVGDQCGCIGPNAAVVAGDSVWWMSDKRFWKYTGGRVEEVPCDVSDYVFNGMNALQGAKFFAASNGAYEEVMWFYCSSSATEPDRYVAYNYRAGHWMIGQLARTAWVDKGAFSNPIAVGVDGYFYTHEQGLLDNGISRADKIYAETGTLETGNGDRITEVMQILPDEKTLGDTRLSFTTRFTPNGQQFSYGPYTLTGDDMSRTADTTGFTADETALPQRTDGYIDARLSGRQITMRVTAVNDNAWQIGQIRWDARATSGR